MATTLKPATKYIVGNLDNGTVESEHRSRKAAVAQLIEPLWNEGYRIWPLASWALAHEIVLEG